MRTSEQLKHEYLQLSTPAVSDALDKLKICCGCQGLRPIVAGKKIFGPAFTVKFVPVGTVKSTAGDFIDEVQPGEVIVIDNAGREYCTVWGNILTFVAKERQLAGTVIDGVCRDVDGIIELDYPIYTKGRFMVTGKDRVVMQSKQQPVALCDVLVNPGDYIMADDSGVLVIPADRVEEVLDIANSIETAENGIISEVAKGATLVEAREKYHYNELQRSKD